MPSLEAVQAAIKKFEEVQQKYAEYGANDTEPDMVFQCALVKTIEYDLADEMLDDANFWELYTTSMDCTEAAKQLAIAAQDCMDELEDALVDSDEREAVLRWIADYCWRINIEIVG